MWFSEFEKLISPNRLAKYKAACNNDTRKAYSLYRANIRLSRSFLAVLSVFEVVLRNKIDLHYKTQCDDSDWLLASTYSGGFLNSPGCWNSSEKVTKCYEELGSNYTHDKLLSKLSFGFWKHMFSGRQYQAGGNTLLAIFSGRPLRCNQSLIYNKLNKINSIRNRVAHHEPICFGREDTISTAYARSHFQEITDLLHYMNVNSQELFYGINGILKEADYIDKLMQESVPA
jgi:hypothetical protein